jgi:Leucine-rich repeat (LRR) protein
LKNIRIFDLSYNELQELPPEFVNLPELEKLYLSHNKIKTLPGEVACLKNITILDLSYNELQKLPPVFVNLPKLEKVDVRYNKLELPCEVKNVNEFCEA